MRYPDGGCDRCGHRIYMTLDGDEFCPNCGEMDEGENSNA